MTPNPVYPGGTASAAPADAAAQLIDQFGDADDIEISTRRGDGTLRSFVPIWIVTVAGALYVRSYRGASGAWYAHATTSQQSGAIRALGQQTDVTFTRVDPAQSELLATIEQAYRAKYARYGDTYLQPMLADQAVAATVALHPTP